MINYDVPLNARGNNANLRANVLNDTTMTANGFTVYKNQWTFKEYIGNNISLYIGTRGNIIALDVVDDDFMQPYDYQWMLRGNKDNAVALEIHGKVQATMKRLSDAGIIEGWVANEYI